MVSRRDMIGMTLGAGATLGLSPRLLEALQQGQLIKRAVPSTGEMLPVVGLGTSDTFSRVARQEDLTALKDVMRTMVEHGASVFDTAPSYGASEQVGGTIAAELGITNKIFWATKVNALQGRGATTADPAAVRAQIQASFDKLKVAKIDLLQVHNLADLPTQLGILKELKKEGKIRYLGTTTTSDNAHSDIMQAMRNEPLDFIGIDYAVDDRSVEGDILPLAQERKIAVLVYVPFGRRRLWTRVEGKELPEWAKEFDATTWAQFFIKYVISHPAITAVTPATSQAKHMLDNIGGGIGKLPDAAMRKRMAEFVDALPAAPTGRGRGGF